MSGGSSDRASGVKARDLSSTTVRRRAPASSAARGSPAHAPHAHVPRAARPPRLAGTLNNFALTLGIYPLLWLMPTRSGIEGNGIFFPEQERALFMH